MCDSHGLKWGGNLAAHRRHGYLFQAFFFFEGKETTVTIPAIDDQARLEEQNQGAEQGRGTVPQSLGDDGQFTGSEDDRTPVAFEADRTGVHQEQLVLIDVQVEWQRPLTQKDAQYQIIDLGQVHHGEWLAERGTLLGIVHDLEALLLVHGCSP